MFKQHDCGNNSAGALNVDREQINFEELAKEINTSDVSYGSHGDEELSEEVTLQADDNIQITEENQDNIQE
jgi:phosphodiesterase/alkaline phosphatase D-like protein